MMLLALLASMFMAMAPPGSATRLHHARLTAAADVTLPKSGMYLVEVRTIGGATPGTFGLNYDGTHVAHFVSPSNATRGRAVHPVNYQVQGNTIPSGSQSFNGGLASVILVFSERPAANAPSIKHYTAIRAARTDAGAVDAAVTATFPHTTRPTRFNALCSASTSEIRFPNVNGFQMGVDAVITEVPVADAPAPDLPPANSIDITVDTAAATTTQVVLYYDPDAKA